MLKTEQAVGVVECPHNLAYYIPEIALLRCVSARQLVYLLLGSNDDPLLAEQDLG